MRLRPRLIPTAPALAALTLLTLAACGSATDSASTSTGGGGSASQSSAGATSGGPTVTTATISGHGTVLVAGANGMTLYVFAKDTPGSGSSACSGACITRWPALTVPSGTTPSAPGISGQWAAIGRSDGATQVTYNGSPLYFFSGDSKPGDVNGNYPEWSAATVAGSSSSSPGGGAAPSPSSPY